MGQRPCPTPAVRRQRLLSQSSEPGAGVVRTSNSQLLCCKSIDKLISESENPETPLSKTLGPWSLTALGIGAIIGSGIFVLTGTAAAGEYFQAPSILHAQALDVIVNLLRTGSTAGALMHGRPPAGPSIAISFLLVAVACSFAGLCYAELASMIPIAGSAYTYSYATLGEIFAWIIGWDLTLEYAMGASTVSSGWSNNFVEFLKIFGIRLPLWLSFDHWTGVDTAQKIVARGIVTQTHPGIVPGSPEFVGALDKLLTAPSADLMARAHALLNAPQIFGIDIGFNVPAFVIALVITTILVIGIQESAKFNSTIVFIKVTVVLFVIGLGIKYIHPDYWGHSWTTFAPFGFAGISAAAGYIFFAYIGFDADRKSTRLNSSHRCIS